MLLTDPVTGHIWSVNMTTFLPDSIPLPDNVRLGSSAFDPVTKRIFYADKGRPAIHSVGLQNSKTYVKLNWGKKTSLFSPARKNVSDSICE